MGFKHGHKSGGKQTRTYNIWCSMLRRCNSIKNDSFYLYGARGIKVCDRWRSFNNFLEDMGNPEPSQSIDRIDTEKGYSPINCRWSDIKTQMNNKRTNVLIEYDGSTKTIAQWAEYVGMKYATLYRRIVVSKWDIKDALNRRVENV